MSITNPENDLRALAIAGLIVAAVVDGVVVILELSNPFGGDSQLAEATTEIFAWGALFVLSLVIAKSTFSMWRQTSRRTRALAVLAVLSPIVVLATGELVSFLRFGSW